MTLLLLAAVAFLAYTNGANDNFKGVASLYGSGTASYRAALVWATSTTAAGSLASIALAETLLQRFSGKGLVPADLAGSLGFVLAVAVGAALTVLVATLTGFPISTTHALTGGILGTGIAAVGADQVSFAALGKSFLLPLLASPLLAVLVGGALYLGLRFVRLRLGLVESSCVCAGSEPCAVVAEVPAATIGLAHSVPVVAVSVGRAPDCARRLEDGFFGLSAERALDAAHFLSAGVVSFARGLNDTPKITALLLVAPGLAGSWGLGLVAGAMAVGGWLGARKVAETMSHRVTTMNHGQGFAANLSTGLLVLTATRFGWPVSTTHVSVGSLFGIGVVTRQANPRVVTSILVSWALTLPAAALLAATTYLVFAAVHG